MEGQSCLYEGEGDNERDFIPAHADTGAMVYYFYAILYLFIKIIHFYQLYNCPTPSTLVHSASYSLCLYIQIHFVPSVQKCRLRVIMSRFGPPTSVAPACQSELHRSLCLLLLFLTYVGSYSPTLAPRTTISPLFSAVGEPSRCAKSSPKGTSSDPCTSVIGPSKCLIYDTTLRDGTQGEGISVSVEDKLSILGALSRFGVDYVEGGWPGSNPKDLEFFERCKSLPESSRSRLVAFGSTRRRGSRVEDDAQVASLLESGARNVCIVAKAHLGQVKDILGATEAEGIAMISDTVSYLVSEGLNVMVDLEHYFDGRVHDPDFSSRVIKACASSGAVAVVLCDTNGGTLPWDVAEATRRVVEDEAVKAGGESGPARVGAKDEPIVSDLTNSPVALRFARRPPPRRHCRRALP